MRKHATVRGDEPPLDLRKAELRSFLSHHKITRERELGAAAQRGAVYGGDCWLVDVVVYVAGETPFVVVRMEQILLA